MAGSGGGGGKKAIRTKCPLAPERMGFYNLWVTYSSRLEFSIERSNWAEGFLSTIGDGCWPLKYHQIKLAVAN